MHSRGRLARAGPCSTLAGRQVVAGGGDDPDGWHTDGRKVTPARDHRRAWLAQLPAVHHGDPQPGLEPAKGLEPRCSRRPVGLPAGRLVASGRWLTRVRRQLARSPIRPPRRGVQGHEHTRSRAPCRRRSDHPAPVFGPAAGLAARPRRNRAGRQPVARAPPHPCGVAAVPDHPATVDAQGGNAVTRGRKRACLPHDDGDARASCAALPRLRAPVPHDPGPPVAAAAVRRRWRWHGHHGLLTVGPHKLLWCCGHPRLPRTNVCMKYLNKREYFLFCLIFLFRKSVHNEISHLIQRLILMMVCRYPIQN